MDCGCGFECLIVKNNKVIDILRIPVSIPWNECQKISLVVSRFWFW